MCPEQDNICIRASLHNAEHCFSTKATKEKVILGSARALIEGLSPEKPEVPFDASSQKTEQH